MARSVGPCPQRAASCDRAVPPCGSRPPSAGYHDGRSEGAGEALDDNLLLRKQAGLGAWGNLLFGRLPGLQQLRELQLQEEGRRREIACVRLSDRLSKQPRSSL